jgi:hypothetical protein
MCEHVRYRHTVGAIQMKVEPGWWLKDNISPEPTNMCQLVPPTLAVPTMKGHDSVVIFVRIRQPIKMKYIEKNVIVKDMDRWVSSIAVAPYEFASLWTGQRHKSDDLELLTSAEPSNEGRIAYGRAATRHFQGGE